MRYPSIPSKLFAEKRKKIAKKMISGSMAIFFSNESMFRNGDQSFPFRQDSRLFSLSGLDQQGTILVLIRGAKNKLYQEMAFILPQDPLHSTWNGDRLTSKQAREISGISDIRMIDQLDKTMSTLIPTVSAIYLNTHKPDRSESEVISTNDRKAAELRQLYPHLHFISSESILREISMIKLPGEIDLMKNAVQTTGMAFNRVLHTIKPGMKEYEVEAELTYILTRQGCYHAFEPIVASGKSACTLHYIRNDRTIKKDELVLIDFGAEYACMASDMTRTIPASGRFSKRQRAVYSSVLKILYEVTSMMRPGIKLEQLNSEAGKLIEHELIKLKILSPADLRKQDPKSPHWKKYFMHGVSHHLGYDVHDLSDKSTPLNAGMVLTCEPGIYLPGEKLGIRLENDILITKSNPKNLMESIPIDPDEIESIMQTRAD